MNKNKRPRFRCLIIAIILLIVHFDAITSYAAPIGTKDSSKIINAIQTTEQGNTKKLYSNLTGKNTVYIRSFKITDLEAPVTGRLLDDTATVVADNGITWEIPVIWVNKDGDIIKIAIEIDDIVRSYPIFVFYIPEGYSLIFGENATYDIGMPEFVATLMKQNGITALSIPEAGRTYISTLLPNTTGFKINIVPPSPTDDTNDSEEKIPTQDPEKNPPGSSSGGGGTGPHLTPPTDNPTEPPDPGLTDDEKLQITDAHCDSNVIAKIGVDKLAALIQWVKKTLEPEAANLLASKFPAYKNAAANDELGKSIGLYIFYDTYYEDDGTTRNDANTLASVNGQWDSTGKYEYRVAVNARHFYTQDANGNLVFDGTKNYAVMDGTLVHEMMHAYMDDYTRTGMTGLQHDTTTTPETYTWGHSDLKFPTWFTEGMASSVDNLFQYRYYSIHSYFDYGYDSTNNEFIADDLKQSYTNSSNIQITGTGEGSEYISGYLACVYLGYLAAQSQNQNVISGNRVESSAILYGENYILEQLHNGRTLDNIIEEISTDASGNTLYKDTAEFESGFIRDGGSSLEFCTTLLNYLQSCSVDGKIANGSILLDFADTNTSQLNLSLLNQNYNVYTPSDSKDFVASSVDKDNALTSGGKSDDGTLNIPTVTPDTAARIVTVNPEEANDEPIQIVGKDNSGNQVTVDSNIGNSGNHIESAATLPSSKDEGNKETIESVDNSISALTTPLVSNDSEPASGEAGTETSINSIVEAINFAINEEAKNQTDEGSVTKHEQPEEDTSDTSVENTSPPAETPTTETAEDVSSSAPEESQPTQNEEGCSEQPNDSTIDSNNSDSADCVDEDKKEIINDKDAEEITDNDSNSESTDSSNAEEDVVITENTDSTDINDNGTSDPQAEEVVDVTITPEIAEDDEIQNGIIISEADTPEDNNQSNDSGSEQILDAMPENPSDKEESHSEGRLATQTA